jgi:hypothetical protein
MQYLVDTKKAIESFGKNVVSKARSNITRKGIRDTGNLYSELKYFLLEKDGTFTVRFDLGKYGYFIDQGVQGANPNIITQWTKNASKKTGVQKAPLSPFRFRGKYPPSKPLEDWAKRKNIRLRDDKGRFKRGNYKAIGYVLSKFIYAQGIKPTYFFSNPYGIANAKLPTDVTQAFIKDLIHDIKEKHKNRYKKNK